MIVVDASALVCVLIDNGPFGKAAAAGMRSGEFLVAPELIDLEVISSLRRKVAAHEITSEQARQAMSELRWFPIKRERHEYLYERIWELRSTITPYDASYVAIAEILNVPLLTCDARLANAPGPTCDFILLQDRPASESLTSRGSS